MKLFAVEEAVIHHVGDSACPECLEDYPESCLCGGMIHAEAVGAEDEDGNLLSRTRCDRCHRSRQDVDEDLGRDPR
jgi:hypothetical protein